MELTKLEEHIRTLATTEETDSPLISCYLDLSSEATGYREEWRSRIHLLRKALCGESAADFEHAASLIEAFLKRGVSARTKGLAAFARGGRTPFWLPLQFEVPLPNWISVGSTPNIFHLVELKDNYDRYVILLTTETSARIIGVNLGSVTAQLWSSRSDLLRRVNGEWTKEHFQDHRCERTKQFIHDQIRNLDRVISAGGYGHLILAGNPRMISVVRKTLPKRLATRLVDSVPACATDRISDIVASTLASFLEHEEQDSQALAAELVSRIYTHGLAVAGTGATMGAIRAGQGEYLVVVKTYDPGRGWQCRGCDTMELETPPPVHCPTCRANRAREFDIRGELVRLAERQEVGIEVVDHDDVLMSLGGVGCLLRYRLPGNYLPSAA